MDSIVPQEKSKAIATEKEECFVEVNKRRARLMKLHVLNQADYFEFAEFFEYFVRLATITVDNKNIREYKYGTKPLTSMIQEYIDNIAEGEGIVAKKDIELGLKLADKYEKALLDSGLVSWS